MNTFGDSSYALREKIIWLCGTNNFGKKINKTGPESFYFYYFSLLRFCSFIFHKKVGEKCKIGQSKG